MSLLSQTSLDFSRPARALVLVLASLVPSFSFAYLTSGPVSDLTITDERQQMLALDHERNRKSAEFHLKRTHVGLELITAGSTTARVASLFGHTVLRIVDADENPMNDTIVGFEQLPISDHDATTKGLKGGYQAVPRFYNLADFLRRDITNEGRSITRTVLPVTPAQLQKLKLVVQRAVAVPGILGD